MKMQLSLDNLKALYIAAKKNNRLEVWADIAIEWMDAAEEELRRLKTVKQISEEEKKDESRCDYGELKK